jgi:hypothetical protein
LRVRYSSPAKSRIIVCSKFRWRIAMAKTKSRRPKPKDDDDLSGTGENPADLVHDEGFEALRTNDAAQLGQYLREAQPPHPEIIKKLADLLDPKGKTSPKLKFVGSRGRPIAENKLLSDANIYMKVRFALKKFSKLEAAIAHVAKQTGKSRSTIFAVWSKRSGQQSK